MRPQEQTECPEAAIRDGQRVETKWRQSGRSVGQPGIKERAQTGRGVRVGAVQGIRRGGEQDAHDQGGHDGDTGSGRIVQMK